MKLLTKYSFKEILPNFFIGLAFFTLILLINEIFRLVAMVVEKNIPMLKVLSLFIYTLPYILAVTIPIGVLVGTIFAVGRLSSDSEVTAMRASGVSILQIFYPCYWFGFIVTVGALLFFQFVLPWGNQSYMKTYYKIIRGNPAVNLLQNQVIDVEGLKIMVDSVDVRKQELYKVRIIDRNNKKLLFAEWGKFLPRDNENNLFPLQLYFTTTQPYIYYPEEFRRNRRSQSSQMSKELRLKQIKQQISAVDKELSKYRKILETRPLNPREKASQAQLVGLKKQLFKEKLRLENNQSNPAQRRKKVKGKDFEERWDEMSLIFIKDTTPVDPQFTGPQMASITDLLNHIKKTRLTIRVMQIKLINQMIKSEVELRKFQKSRKQSPNDPELKMKIKTYKQRLKNYRKQIEFYFSGSTIDRQILYQFNNKLSIPFACLIFAMIAAPLGIYSRRSGKGVGIGIALLVLVGYRILMVIGQLGYTKNIMSPIVGAWLPNLLTVGAAVYFTYEKVTGRVIQIRIDWVVDRVEDFKKWWSSKHLTVMQAFFYIFSFPFRLPYKIIMKSHKIFKLRKYMSRPARASRFKARYDDIFGEVEYTKSTQKFPGYDKN